MNEAIRFNHEYAWAYGIRGHVYKQLGQKNQAIQDFEKAISLDPNLDWAKKELMDIQENNTSTLPPVKENDIFTDKRDGKKYKTIKIGTQELGWQRI